MKLFTGSSGKFQMFIPIEWEYKNPSFYSNEQAPESFEKYTKMIGAFQISCKPVNKHISDLISLYNLTIHNSSESTLHFKEIFAKNKGLNIHTWMSAVDDHFFLATYIYGKKKSKKELNSVKKTLKTIKFIKPQYRNQVIALDRFDHFMASMAATIDLRNRALESRSFIEYVVLSANNIDALLRLSIILTNQLEQKNKNIDTSYLFQGKEDKPIWEKEIYKKALSKKIISNELFDKLYKLYEERNKVVHRYIITDIRTKDLRNIALKYSEIEDTVSTIVGELEQKQFKEKVGIYGTESPPERKIKGIELKRLRYQVRDKHGNIRWPDDRNLMNLLRKWIRLRILKKPSLNIY